MGLLNKIHSCNKKRIAVIAHYRGLVTKLATDPESISIQVSPKGKSERLVVLLLAQLTLFDFWSQAIKSYLM